jgi:hypothetical protein
MRKEICVQHWLSERKARDVFPFEYVRGRIVHISEFYLIRSHGQIFNPRR